MKQTYTVKKAADQAFMTFMGKILWYLFTVRIPSQSGWGASGMWRGFFTFFARKGVASDIYVV